MVTKQIQAFIEKNTSENFEEGFQLPSSIFLLEVKISKSRPKKVTIILDGDEGISIDQCALVSRKLGAFLEEQNPFGEEAYNLEVTSPGINYGLHVFRQYPQHVGRKIEFVLKDGSKKLGKLQSIEGHLLHITEEYEVMEGKKPKKKTKYKPATIDFEQVAHAKVQIAFK